MKINDHDIILYAGGIVNKYDENVNIVSPSFDFAVFKIPPKIVNTSKHNHSLVFNGIYCEGKCNICNKEGYGGGYECKEAECKYIYCFKCYKKTNEF